MQLWLPSSRPIKYMSPKQLAIIGCRLLALYLFALLMNTVGQLWLTMSLRAQAPEVFLATQNFQYAGVIVTAVINAFLCFLLWERAPWVAKLITKDAEGPVNNLGPLPVNQLFQSVGLLALLFRLPSLGEGAYFAFMSEREDPAALPLFWINLPVVLLALFFLLGARRISSSVQKFWSPSDGQGNAGDS